MPQDQKFQKQKTVKNAKKNEFDDLNLMRTTYEVEIMFM